MCETSLPPELENLIPENHAAATSSVNAGHRCRCGSCSLACELAAMRRTIALRKAIRRAGGARREAGNG